MQRAGWIGVMAVVLLLVPGVRAQAVDHAGWEGLLRRHVQNGLVDYQGVKQEEAQLNQYLASVQGVQVAQLPKDAQLAFWINAYNACVFRGVLDHQPLKSVRDVKGFFDKLTYRVGGGSMVLNDMEKQARAFGDWRTHAAVNCASTSCPPLRAEAYLPERVEAQLAEQAAKWLADPQRGLRLDDKTLWVSKIFKWYARDFVASGKTGATEMLLPVIRPYIDPALAQRIEQGHPEVKFMDYDWTLNAQPNRAS